MIINLLIMNILFLYISGLNINKIIFSGYSEITLKVNQKGSIAIYSDFNEEICLFMYDNQAPAPKEIYINGVNQSTIKYKYDFNETENEVKLIFHENIDNTICMFYKCSNITEINFSNFNTEEVVSMAFMFYECTSLKSLDLSNFNTSKVENMYGMFIDCSSITQIILNNFDSSKVTDMGSMFLNCSSLVSLNLSNFDTNKVSIMTSTFQNCDALEYINLEHAEINGNLNTKDIFNDTSQNLIICSNNEKWNEIFNGFYLYDVNCNNKYNETQKNIMKCYSRFLNNENNNKYKCENCGLYYYQINEDIYNNDTYINCYENVESYYLDKDELNPLFKPCYSTCQKCDSGGNETNHNCLQCKDDYNLELNLSNYINCYKICPHNYYIEETTNKTYCTPDLSCPEKYPKLIQNKSQCIDNCEKDPVFKYDNQNICLDTFHNDTQNNTSFIDKIEINKTNEIINDMNNINSFSTTDITLNETIINNKLEFERVKEYLLTNFNERENKLEIPLGNIIISLKTLNQEKNNTFKNKTSIDLGLCETLIKSLNNISENNILYLLKIEVAEEGMKIPKIEYELYNLIFNNNTLNKLDLSPCKNMKIDISIPVKIGNYKIDKYNISSDYYNNICSKETSEYGTDISLNDRKNKFINDNMTLCEEDCDLVDYNYTTEKANCSCLVKINLPFIGDIKFDKDKLIKRFIDIKNIANFKFMKCIKNVELKNNYGFFIYIFIIAIYIVCLFLFYFKFFNLLKGTMLAIVNKKKSLSINSKDKDEENNANIKHERNKIKSGTDIKTNKNKMVNKIKRKKKIKSQRTNLKNKSKSDKTLIETVNHLKGVSEIKNYNNDNNIEINNENNNKIDEIIELNNSELNSLPYEKALEKDKRTFIQYYISLLRINHLLIFSFYFYNKDYNSQIIKMLLFFFFFSVHFMVNALFFNDDTMHKILIDEGSYNFVYQIPKIIYSTIISGVINFLIKFLSLSEKNILSLKHEKNENILDKILLRTIKILSIKFVLFFVITFLLLFFFMYYITCFCGIYVNTQIHLIKDSILSFTLSLINPFWKYLIPGLFRIPALRAGKKNKKFIYRFSQILEII